MFKGKNFFFFLTFSVSHYACYSDSGVIPNDKVFIDFIKGLNIKRLNFLRGFNRNDCLTVLMNGMVDSSRRNAGAGLGLL